jgi:AMMECR1 domain-containing protein
MEAYLKQQAEELITGYYFTLVHPVNGEKVRTRAFVSLTTDRKNGGGYRGIVGVLSDADLKAQLIADAMADLAAFKQRYKHLHELASLFGEIEKLERRHGSKTNRRVATRSASEARAFAV